MAKRTLHDGREDGLTPLESLRLSEVDSFADLVRAMSKTALPKRVSMSAGVPPSPASIGTKRTTQMKIPPSMTMWIRRRTLKMRMWKRMTMTRVYTRVINYGERRES